ncbi:HU-CCDC81 and SPOR domain-containing protein [Kordia sp. YSTF-M3]|uniref:HU-CCDC81 and SPOR domain-containing protein n=1 Tax=Kordia aestuariivivens TaxID=2759037 RepID=A0ABR7Q9M2_9FLAO|nr:SPOR domain-containing protein [Kordia aestuariivivens]MBC8755281.1 HU-CCDC81 and SPOR domain-containing protein [Kordia aestuariivivens]
MRLDTYISDLLYRYECVTVPNFGAFLTQRKGAQVHHTTNAFYPPSKVVSFNAQLSSNDGLLVKYIADITGEEYENTLQKVLATVAEWKQTLQNAAIVSLENIGDLSFNVEGNIQFEPSYHLNYLTASFGLSSFVSSEISRVITKPEEVAPVIAQEETAVIPLVVTEERSRFRFPWKYAAAAVVVFSIVGVFGLREYQSQQQIVEQSKAQESINAYIQQATFFNSNPVELPSITLQVAKEVKNYHVVAGAFRIEENAHTKVAQLQANGFEAELLGQNKYGLHQVSYASFASRNEATNALIKIKKTEAPEAWLLVTE